MAVGKERVAATAAKAGVGPTAGLGTPHNPTGGAREDTGGDWSMRGAEWKHQRAPEWSTRVATELSVGDAVAFIQALNFKCKVGKVSLSLSPLLQPRPARERPCQLPCSPRLGCGLARPPPRTFSPHAASALPLLHRLGCRRKIWGWLPPPPATPRAAPPALAVPGLVDTGTGLGHGGCGASLACTPGRAR